MLFGRIAAPLPDLTMSGAFMPSWPSDGRSILIRIPEGGVPVGRLARDVETTWGAPAWVRVEPYDIDPPAIGSLLSTAMAMAHGDAFGDPAATRPPVWVVEGIDRLHKAVVSDIMERVCGSAGQLIVLAARISPHIVLLDQLHIREAQEFSIDEVSHLIDGSGVPCSPSQLHALAEGHFGTVEAVARATKILGPP